MPTDYRQTIVKLSATIATYRVLMLTELADQERQQVEHVLTELLLSRAELEAANDVAPDDPSPAKS